MHSVREAAESMGCGNQWIFIFAERCFSEQAAGRNPNDDYQKWQSTGFLPDYVKSYLQHSEERWNRFHGVKHDRK